MTKFSSNFDVHSNPTDDSNFVAIITSNLVKTLAAQLTKTENDVIALLYNNYKPWKNCGLLALPQMYSIRLGNIANYYASLRAIAEETNRIPLIPRKFWVQLSSLFRLGNDVAVPYKFVGENLLSLKSFRRIGDDNHCCIYTPGLVEKIQPYCGFQHVVLAHSMQAFRYWQGIEKKIRSHYFAIKPDILESARFKLAEFFVDRKMNRSDIHLIAVHIRTGDKASSAEIAEGHLPADENYVKKALDYSLARTRTLKPVAFLFFGEDPRWALAKFGETVVDDHDLQSSSEKYATSTLASEFNVTIAVSKGYRFVMNPISPEVDLAMMTECDRMIMTVGSFGWWAGFFQNSPEVIYQREFCKNGSYVCSQYSADDLENFLPGWVGL